MSSKHASDPAGIVTSDAVYHGHMGRKLLIGLLGLVVLGAVIAGTYYGAQKAGLVSLGTPGNDNKHGNVNLSPAEAVKAAQAKVDSAHTSGQKQSAYTALGDAYSANGQISQSTAAYQQALDYTVDSSLDNIVLLERLSANYEAEGDKTNAIDTLQKLIKALNATSSISEDEQKFLLSRYQAELKYERGGV